jgi:PD-(D/E)XK endonuclease
VYRFGKDKQAAGMGLAAHTAVLHKLVSKGLEVLQPLGDHLRYDLEETGELVRIQCKAGRYEAAIGCVLFKSFNRTGGRGKRRSYVGDAEYFGVYRAELNTIYFIPLEKVPSADEVHLRIQQKTIRKRK